MGGAVSFEDDLIRNRCPPLIKSRAGISGIMLKLVAPAAEGYFFLESQGEQP
jgi:hypothetical protein